MTDEIETSEDRVRKAVGLVLTRRKAEEIVHIRSDQGFRVLYIRHDMDADGEQFVWLKFKRTPEIKPYYATIKKWCEERNLAWEDKTYKRERYISVRLEPDIDQICEFIISANADIFHFKATYAGSESSDFNFALQDMAHPLLLGLFGLGSAIGLGLLPIYELFRLPSIGAPSIQALDWPEIFLLFLILCGFFVIRYIKRNQRKTKSPTAMKIKLGRAIILLCAGLTFFTY